MSKASKQWEKAVVSHENYIRYLERKKKKFELSIIDILYIRNFKGGQATTHEEEASLDNKLREYSRHLSLMHQQFGNEQLRDLSDDELELLKQRVRPFLELTSAGGTSIDGFKSSYASTLLHFYFPDLVPILDKRVLKGAHIAKVNSQSQIRNMKSYYPELIHRFYVYLKNHPNKSLRDYDKELFDGAD